MVRGNRRDCGMRFRRIWVVVVVVVVLQVVSGYGNANYGDALSKCLLSLEAQRSGRLPYTQRVSWRDHSGLTDGLLQGVDLVGGYYDAGDHVKFGLPMAFTVTMLSWSVVEYGEQLAAAGQLGHTLEAIKWGTDYFLKAHSHPHLQLLWGEVGDGNTDHYCWQRPEDMTTPRQAYKIDAANPGSDLAGETAAAMASASIVFRASNPSYSNLLLHHAKQLFEFGDKYRGKYDQSIGVVKNYYTSVSGYGDELLWGASWMYQATGNEDYLKYIVDNAESLGGTGWAITEFSWDVKYAGLQVLAAKVLMQGQGTQYSSTLEKYKSKAEFFLCACLQMNDPDSNVHLTPGGLLYIRQWNNMQYVSSASFLLTVYSDYLAAAKASLNCPKAQMNPSRLLDFATSQSSLYNVWLKTAQLRASVAMKRIQYDRLRYEQKIRSVIAAHASLLNQWEDIEEDHMVSVAEAKDCLDSATVRVPLVAGAKADVDEVKQVLGYSMQVMQGIQISMNRFWQQADNVGSLLPELAEIVIQERALLQQTSEMLSILSSLEEEERSLKAHLIQMHCQVR